jgi:hypothetical protein
MFSSFADKAQSQGKGNYRSKDKNRRQTKASFYPGIKKKLSNYKINKYIKKKRFPEIREKKNIHKRGRRSKIQNNVSNSIPLK